MIEEKVDHRWGTPQKKEKMFIANVTKFQDYYYVKYHKLDKEYSKISKNNRQKTQAYNS